MSEPFLAEIRIVGFNFAMRGWAFCDGQILPIEQNQSLYSLLGTTYGGDGRNNFALPDLRGRTPIHVGTSDGGTNHMLGQKSGEEKHSLTVGEMPRHNHTAQAANDAPSQPAPNGGYLGRVNNGYVSGNTNPSLVKLADGEIADTGGSQGHDNMQPYLAINFCIALRGLFPSRN